MKRMFRCTPHRNSSTMTVDYQTTLEKQQAKYNNAANSLHPEFTMLKQQALLVYR